MSEIVKTKAIVLNKINFGDTSRIANFFTEDFGKIPIIIKGARSPKSKVGLIVDTMNYVEIVFYKKENREIQFSSQIELLKYFSKIREDYEKLIYSNAIIELLNTLLMENEPHKLLFAGTVKIFDLINDSNENPKFLFAKYFLFFLKEIGYDIQTEICNSCGQKIVYDDEVAPTNGTTPTVTPTPKPSTTGSAFSGTSASHESEFDDDADDRVTFTKEDDHEREIPEPSKAPER